MRLSYGCHLRFPLLTLATIAIAGVAGSCGGGGGAKPGSDAAPPDAAPTDAAPTDAPPPIDSALPDAPLPDARVIDAAICVMPGFTAGVSTLAGCTDAAAIDGTRAMARFANPVNVAVAADGR